MALTIANNRDTTIPYVSYLFKGDENPFTVTLKRLPVRDFSKLEDNLTKYNQEEKTVSVATGSFNYNLCRRGIVSWKNIRDEKGAEIKINFDTNGLVSEDSMELLPPSLIEEIGAVIATITRNPELMDLYLKPEVE